jgi:hypothetical protein
MRLDENFRRLVCCAGVDKTTRSGKVAVVKPYIGINKRQIMTLIATTSISSARFLTPYQPSPTSAFVVDVESQSGRRLTRRAERDVASMLGH